MCGDTEPNTDTSIYCPYPDDEHGTWTVQTEFINSKPGVAVYVGTSILEINGSHICQKQFVMIVTLNSNFLSQINIWTTASWVMCSIRRLAASAMRCSKAPYMILIIMRLIQLVITAPLPVAKGCQPTWGSLVHMLIVHRVITIFVCIH